MGDEGQGEAQGPEADDASGLDPIAAALAMSAAAHGPPLDPRLASYLAKQEKLVEIQTEHLHGQRALILKQLSWRLHSDQLKCVLQAITTTVGFAIVVWLSVVVWQAAHARGLVVEAFLTPPDLTRDGLTGQVIAEEVEDRINALQAKTNSARAPDTFANDWGRDIKVEIPDTGVSLGEVQRQMREWLGHETRLSGAVIRSAKHVRISARLKGEPADEASGPESDIDGVVSQVAEKVFARTQPYRYGIYLAQNGRTEEARGVLERLAADGPQTERGWALIGLAFLSPDAASHEKEDERAVAADPKLVLARANLADMLWSLGHWEAALEQLKVASRLLARPDHGGVRKIVVDEMGPETQALTDDLLEDHADALAQVKRAAALPTFHGSQLRAQMARACELAALHDSTAARAQAARFGQDDIAAVKQSVQFGDLSTPHGCVALADRDWREAARQFFAVDEALTPEQRTALASRTILWPDLAHALSGSGDVAKAEALIGLTPLDCYPCLIARGSVASAKGDARSAERWFAEAARQGPSLPRAYEAWGEARLARGDLVGAAAAFQDAALRRPNWADPMKGLGDVAAGRGDWRKAVDYYNKALLHAPAWAELKRARVLAARHL